MSKCACMSVVAFGEIKRLQRIFGEPLAIVYKPSKLEVEIAENQYKNTIKFLTRAEEECKINMEKVRSNLIQAVQAFKNGEPLKAVDKVIDADVQLRLAICPKE